MLHILFWIAIGALSGWIGYLATRTEESGHVRSYLIVGMVGGLLGGFIARNFGLSTGSFGIDGSVFNALITSALLILIFVVLLNFFGDASSS